MWLSSEIGGERKKAQDNTREWKTGGANCYCINTSGKAHTVSKSFPGRRYLTILYAASSIDRRPQSGYFAPTKLARVSSSYNTQTHMNGWRWGRDSILPQADVAILASFFSVFFFFLFLFLDFSPMELRINGTLATDFTIKLFWKFSQVALTIHKRVKTKELSC